MRRWAGRSVRSPSATRTGDHYDRVLAMGPGLAWLERPRLSRGAAWGDLDGTATWTASTPSWMGPHRLLNEGGASAVAASWYASRIPAPELARARRPGARATASGTQSRWVTSGDGYMSAHGASVHFGLGDHRGAVQPWQALARWG